MRAFAVDCVKRLADPEDGNFQLLVDGDGTGSIRTDFRRGERDAHLPRVPTLRRRTGGAGLPTDDAMPFYWSLYPTS